MSGDPGAEDLQGFAASTGLPVLGKPFTFTQLRDTIRGLTAG
jgi:hypothetical protein